VRIEFEGIHWDAFIAVVNANAASTHLFFGLLEDLSDTPKSYDTILHATGNYAVITVDVDPVKRREFRRRKSRVQKTLSDKRDK